MFGYIIVAEIVPCANSNCSMLISFTKLCSEGTGRSRGGVVASLSETVSLDRSLYLCGSSVDPAFLLLYVNSSSKPGALQAVEGTPVAKCLARLDDLVILHGAGDHP